MTTKFQGSGRVREGGMAGTHRRDFAAHTSGSDWRHTADHTDMNPEIDTGNFVFQAPTVQETLQKFATYLTQIGHGYVTIGDGYDLSASDFMVNPGTTAQQAFADAFAHPRLANGGIVLVKAGTYRLTETVTVPVGITILGEPSGTYIFGSMSEQPMFRCLKSTRQFRLGTVSGTDFDAVQPSDCTTFINLVLGDNLDGYALDGLNNPRATMTTVPMIQMAHGANVIFDRVSLIGRMNNTFPPFTLTKRAIGLDNTTTAPNQPTSLLVKDCYIDGVSQGIFFDVRNGSIDILRVEKTRARIYGGLTDEDSAFVSFNMCNAHLEGNYHIGGGVGLTNCFYLRNATVSNVVDTKINIINNSGGISDVSLLVADTNDFFVNDSEYTSEGTNVGNSWGGAYNPWVITIGDGTNSVGDLTGTGAIDTAIQITKLATAISNRIDIFAVVGYGIYTVTVGETTGKLNLLGKIRNGAYPILNLDSSTGTDEAGNATTGFGGHIENIKFTTDSGAAGYNTIKINQGQTADSTQTNKHHTIKNCLFIDAGLVVAQFTRSTNKEMNSILIENCKFSQTGAFADNLGFLLPISADSVYLKNVTVHDKGYVGGVGNATGYTGTAPPESIIVLDGCLFDQNSTLSTAATDAITAASPLSGSNHYFFINSSRAKVFIKNTTITCADDLSSVTATGVIGGGLPAAGSFTKYISLQARDIVLDNSSVLGPNQTYISGGVTYSMPALWAEPRQTITVTGCKLKGACALQISGTNQFDSVDQAASIILSDTNMFGFTGASSASSTTLDIDAKSFTASGEAVFPYIAITNCCVDNRFAATNTNVYVQHVNNITTDYTGLGVAQIYAAGWNVRISNSKFDGKLGTNLPAGFDALVCLYVDTLTALTATLTDAFVLVSNNSIKFACDLNTGVSSNRACCVWTEAVRLQFNNNSINYIVTTSGGSNLRNYMLIKAQSSADDGSIVSNNTFAKSGGGTLNSSAITIASTTGQGSFINNDFDSPTLDGSITDLIVDLSTPKWRKERNRNQTDTIAITAWTGIQKIDGTSLGFTATDYDFIPNESTGGLDYLVGTGAAAVGSVWGIDLTSVLPQQTHVISATADISFSGGSATGNHFLVLRSTTQGDNSANVVGPTGDTATVTATTPTTNYIINSILRPFLLVHIQTGNSGGGSPATTTVTPVIVTYRW